MRTIRCDACGKKWEDHDGIASTCSSLQSFRDLSYSLCTVLLDAKIPFQEKMVLIGLLVDAIRNLDKESYDERVLKPCGIQF